jgi:cupin fold WbuC family metalloprotein
MKIYDENNNLLAEIIEKDAITNEKNFYTKETHEFQVASFNLKKNTVIKRHIHNLQERTITSTSEVIVVLDGEIEVEIYNLNQILQRKCVLSAGDTIALFSGGHGLKSLNNAKFIEVKQGPYNPYTDKKLF